ncbi:MAG: sugar ABC transporter substrate-binding protein [Gemmatimonadota bacterium]|nr:MAG: sugar ABC transporter substrate-binding protein [Gemmatimonadota bacterium]
MRRKLYLLPLLPLLPLPIFSAGCRPAPDAQITLRVLNWATDLEVMAEQRIADGFSAQRPGVRVIVQSVVTNYTEKLATEIASGSPPDVFLLDASHIPTFVERGLALDLSPYIARVGYETARVFPEVLQVFDRQGRLYAFPKGFTPMVLYYNRTLFDELNVDPPPEEGWTWDEFLETAKAVTRDVDGDGQTDAYAVDFPRRLYEWIPWVWSAGGDILDPQGMQAAGYLDSEVTVATFEFLASLITVWQISPVQFLRGGDPMRTGRFYVGDQAMLHGGHWMLPRLLHYNARGDIELGVAPIPHRTGAAPQNVLYTSGWAVPVNVRHKRLALELAAFLASEGAQRSRAASGLEIAAFRDVALEFAAADTLGLERVFLNQVRGSRLPWGALVKDFYEIEELAFDIMDRHLLRGEDLAATAASVASEIDRMRAR